MTLNLDKLVSSQSYYDKLIKQTIEIIKRDKDMEATLKKVILFCKYAFSVNYAQRKKILCLNLIKDISQSLKSGYFQKTLDENIPIKLLKTISNEVLNTNKESRHQDDEHQYSQKLVKFAVETISFWTKKLSFLTGKSQFSDAYEQLKKMKVEIPKNYDYYKSQKLTLGLWGSRDENSQQYVKNQQASPVISQLFDKFEQCKSLIEQKINQAVINEQQIYLKIITQKLRDFLLLFFSRYKNLETQTSLDRDVLIVYFHIINQLFKRVCNKFYIPYQEMISLAKQIYQGNHNADFSSVDRMDIVNLAGIHKYNALSIFQRIHQRIQIQEAKLGPCELNFEQKDVLVYANQKNTVPLKKDKFLDNEEKKNPRFKR